MFTSSVHNCRRGRQIAGGKPAESVYGAISLPNTQAFAYEFLAPGGALLHTLALQIPKDKKKADNNAKIVHVSGDVHTSKNRQLGIEQYN